MEELSSRHAFSGFMVDVADKRFRRADGSEVERQVVEHPGSAGVLAYDDEGVYLVRQSREAVGADALLEIPAGTLDGDEEPLTCAKRELSEEVDLEASEWTHVRDVYTTPGTSDETTTIFFATGLSPRPGELDEEEDIEVVKVPLAELGAAIEEAADAKTLIALLIFSAEAKGTISSDR